MILEAEPDVRPDHLFTDSEYGDGRRWWLAHTKPRQEKALARELDRGGLSYYLPCLPRRVRAGRRVLISRVPLFPGYAFLRLADAEKNKAYAGHRILALHPVADQELLWFQLRQVRKLLDLGRPVNVEDQLPPGTPISIRTGPLAGMTGTIVRAAGMKKFVVKVDLIGRGLSVVVDSTSLGRRE